MSFRGVADEWKGLIGAVGLSLAGGVLCIVLPFFSWYGLGGGNVLYLFGVPDGPGRGHVYFNFQLRGMATGPGRCVFGSGIAIAILALVAAVYPKARSFAGLTALPGLVVAGATGYWARHMVPLGPLGRGVSLYPLLGTLAVVLAGGLWPTTARSQGRLVRSCIIAVAGLLVCGIAFAATSPPSGYVQVIK